MEKVRIEPKVIVLKKVRRIKAYEAGTVAKLGGIWLGGSEQEAINLGGRTPHKIPTNRRPEVAIEPLTF